MEKLIAFLKIVLLALALTSCVSKPFKITSEPDNVEVFLVSKEDGERKSLGQTPIIKKKKEMSELMDKEMASGSMIQLQFEKDGYTGKDLWIPSTAGGSLGINIEVTMEEGTSSFEHAKNADQIIEKLFFAQNLARTQQFERAVIEIDKLLERFPKLTRALSMKGAILYASSSLKESLEAYEKALELNPELKTALEMSSKIRKQLKMPNRSVAKSN